MSSISSKLLVIALFLFLVSCSSIQKDESTTAIVAHARENSSVDSNSAELFGEQIEISLGKLLSSPKMKLGHTLNAQDQQILGSLANNTLDQTNDNDVATWGNSATGHAGEFRVLSTEGHPQEQLVCRNFVHTLIINNEKEVIYGKACRSMWDPKKPWLLHK